MEGLRDKMVNKLYVQIEDKIDGQIEKTMINPFDP
jgi:hypothetical protein